MASQAGLCYNKRMNIVLPEGVSAPLWYELHLIERQAHGNSIRKLSPTQALCFPLYKLWREVMRPQKGTPEYEAMRQKMSASAKRRMSDPDERAKFLENGKKGGFTKGQVAHNKGKPMSAEQNAKLQAGKMRPESLAKMAETKRGQKLSEKHRKNIGKGLEGHECPPQARNKIGAAHKGLKHSPESIAKMSASHRGKPGTRLGKKTPPETRAKLSIVNPWKGKRIPHLEASTKTESFRAKAAARERAKWQNRSEDDKRAHLDKLHEGGRNITDSWIENAYAKQLDIQGIAYERQKRIGWYRVDFYIEAENRIVEINGCYWHCCEQCGCGNEHPGKREKDMKRYEYLRRKGYIVEIVWEHDLPKKPYHRHRSRK